MNCKHEFLLETEGDDIKLELVMNAVYDYGFLMGVCLIACDIEKEEVVLKDKNGNEKSVCLSLFRRYGKLIYNSNVVS